ncbi:MAG TPA: hypothetical protein VEP91_09040 [Solirubrobacterales bacterium]|nr:hypothetical protein [Solirubrobacterales bacterium]
MSRALRIALATAALFATLALPAQAGEKLTIAAARDRALNYAETTCKHDSSCAKAGVQNCRRHSRRVVLCRIFDHRKTEEQGNFVCTRLVRLALQPKSGKIPVTGVSDWNC